MTISIRQQTRIVVVTLLFVGGLAITLFNALIAAEPAYADQYDIETLTETYETATEQAAEATARAKESEAKVAALEAEVQAQQERTDTAIRYMYVLEQDKFSLLDAMLNAESLDDFVKYADYLEHTTKVNAAQLEEMRDLLSELKAAHEELEQARQEAAAQEALAHEALLVLQDQRAAKQQNAHATDGADWYMSKEEFIAEWAPRIDAYFAGTAMANTGESFARAAWLNCVDPRWSPAISNVESGKGAKCIRPYNAWGWGAADSDPKNLASEWSSWDEAINAHVQGLARGYGYTVSPAAAAAYCPSNSEQWYEAVVSEMAMI